MNKKNFFIIGWIILIIIMFFILIYFYPNKNGWNQQFISQQQTWWLNLSEKQQESQFYKWTQIIDCAKSNNKNFKAAFTIKLEDIKKENKYKEKKQEAINLINLCYDILLIEEYEVKKGQTSTQEWNFINKININSRVFDKLTLFPGLDLYDYTSVALDDWLTYVYNGNFDELLKYYSDITIKWYKQTPSDSENKIIFTDIDTTKKVLTINFNKIDQTKTLVNFSYTEPLE